MCGIGLSYRISWSPWLVIPLVTVPSDLIHNLLKSVPIQPWPTHRKLVFGPSVLPSSSSKVMKVNTRLSFTGLGQFDAGVGSSTGAAGACAQAGFIAAVV